MKSRLKFSEEETTSSQVPETSDKHRRTKQIRKLEHKSERLSERLDEAVIRGEKPHGRSRSRYIESFSRSVVAKAHGTVYRVEDENVGTKAVHRAELMGEQAYRGSKQNVRRVLHNRPMRRAHKLTKRSTKASAKLSHTKAKATVKNTSVASKHAQKKVIKRRYATAKQNALFAKKGTMLLTKPAMKIVSVPLTLVVKAKAILFSKPMVIIALVALVIVALIVMATAVLTLFGGGFSGAVSGFVTSMASFQADYEDIDNAANYYKLMEFELWYTILNIEITHSGYDIFRFDVDPIGHDPFELVAFLTAVYGEFSFAQVRPTLRALFEEQYTFALHSAENINRQTILFVWLDVVPLRELMWERMDDEQREHFELLLMSRGLRQVAGNPFSTFNWLPHVSSHFGYRIDPIYEERRFHGGVDITMPIGTPLYAPFDGTITRARYDRDGNGWFVVIDNGEGWQALFAHCHRLFVREGEQVETGQVIGEVGNTGASTGSHLHMEIFRNGRRLNPIFWVMG